MANEQLLNSYYNKGGFNKPERIGYMMNMIRKLRPLTEEEWEIWYLKNIHDEKYLDELADEMWHSIPETLCVSKNECRGYIYDVMFRRTFLGYNKEKLALRLLRNTVSPDVQEAPKEWDTEYFIDFYIRDQNDSLIGIQLKPETFFHGGYQNFVDIKGKMKAFCRDFHANAYVLTYRQTGNNANKIEFTNPEVIDEIKQQLV